MTEFTPTERLSRAIGAERELELTSKAFDAVRHSLLEAIAATPMHDAETRERLYMAVNVLPRVKQMLIACVNDGVVAHSEIQIAEHFAAEGRAN